MKWVEVVCFCPGRHRVLRHFLLHHRWRGEGPNAQGGVQVRVVVVILSGTLQMANSNGFLLHGKNQQTKTACLLNAPCFLLCVCKAKRPEHSSASGLQPGLWSLQPPLCLAHKVFEQRWPSPGSCTRTACMCNLCSCFAVFPVWTHDLFTLFCHKTSTA